MIVFIRDVKLNLHDLCNLAILTIVQKVRCSLYVKGRFERKDALSFFFGRKVTIKLFLLKDRFV